MMAWIVDALAVAMEAEMELEKFHLYVRLVATGLWQGAFGAVEVEAAVEQNEVGVEPLWAPEKVEEGSPE